MRRNGSCVYFYSIEVRMAKLRLDLTFILFFIVWREWPAVQPEHVVVQLLAEAAPLCCPDCVHWLPYPRHVPGEECEEGAVQAHHAAHALQAEKKSLKLRKSSLQQSHTVGPKRNVDRTTRLLVVILVLFIIAEFPPVRMLSSLARVTFLNYRECLVCSQLSWENSSFLTVTTQWGRWWTWWPSPTAQSTSSSTASCPHSSESRWGRLF